MRFDREIQRDVEAELKWTPEVDDTDVAVKVQDGAVALTGFVHNSFQKYRAERAARRVKGVAAVANDIQVRWLGTVPTDPEIARSAGAILRSDLPSAAEQIRPMVFGSTPTDEYALIRASGVRPSRVAVRAVIIKTAAAPSLMPEALPAVTVPSLLNAGFSFPSDSAVVP